MGAIRETAVGAAIGFAFYGTVVVVLRAKKNKREKEQRRHDGMKDTPDDGDVVDDTVSDNKIATAVVPWKRHAKAFASLPLQATVAMPSLVTYLGGGPKFFFGVLNMSSNSTTSTTPTEASSVAAALAQIGAVALSATLFATGSYLLYRTNRLFHEARGTLAPWDPPREFVVTGPYRYVRNPMLSGVNLILASEIIVLGRPGLVGFTAAFLTFNTYYFVTVEEPELSRRYGQDYEAYRKAVPRWIPRMKPYVGPKESRKEQ
eukprot:CAMPEP_0178713508 /NCGR_PEP_ID=MMETSP0699-20121125/19461_1 /TAXON_ID=265572 /ORGANISM="Extubocellulus spinifer, Strain CCMP396" /LENGTH=260 /DNA_ID=CAMNT_0020362347 /DNA_START=141 /DNA_END=923 /DNA_ORIENTATION=-